MMSSCGSHSKNQQQVELCFQQRPLSPRNEYSFPFPIHSLMRSKLHQGPGSFTFASTCSLQVNRPAQFKETLWPLSIRYSLKNFIDTALSALSRNLSAN